MAGLWRNNPETPEGKFPIVLRRDGTPLTARFIVMTLKDVCTDAALRAYAQAAKDAGLDPKYAEEISRLADESVEIAAIDQNLDKPTSDPDASRHREDDPVTLAWARSLGCPGS